MEIVELLRGSKETAEEVVPRQHTAVGTSGQGVVAKKSVEVHSPDVYKHEKEVSSRSSVPQICRRASVDNGLHTHTSEKKPDNQGSKS